MAHGPRIENLGPLESAAYAEARVNRAVVMSVDLYSSTTPIPYVITGIANSTTVFSIQKTQGNTFGNFATVVNPNPTTLIDALLIRLSNPAAPCCSNPMGLDNIVVLY